MSEKTFMIEWQCQQFLNKVANLLDGRQWEELVECYAEDATLIRPSAPDSPVEGREKIKASYFSQPPRTSCHFLTNSVFEVVDDTTVYATSRALLVASQDSGKRLVIANSRLMVGTFKDTLKKVDGKWLIAERNGSVQMKYDYNS